MLDAAQSKTWPDYLIERAIASPPENCDVVPGATPVVAFGDPTAARVASLGINPSSLEFLGGDDRLLTEDRRRLATLDSLGIDGYGSITDELGRRIIQDCVSYFHRRPYRRWFGPLDDILRAGLDVSYFDGSACHLDLVQWATKPFWAQLSPVVQDRLLRADLPFLRRQLTSEQLRVVVVNGRTAMSWIERAGILSWDTVARLDGPPTIELATARSSEIAFVGWSANLQSQPGARRHADDIIRHLAGHHGIAERRQTGSMEIAGGAIPRGTRVASVNQLVEVLSRWLETTNEATIGDTSHFGGKAWLWFEASERPAALNADTRREAVERFVRWSRVAGSTAELQVVANRRGLLNKLVFDPANSSGWYAHLERAESFAPRGGVRASLPRRRPAKVRRRSTIRTRSVVQFPHPGGEHVPAGDMMDWNVGPHRRKFLSVPGTIVGPEGRTVSSGPVVFWGEWEAPSDVIERWTRERGLPTVVHDPWWEPVAWSGPRSNTDPWVFGEHFIYSNCRQIVNRRPSSLQRLDSGSLILFGSGLDGEFVLDTVFVVGGKMGVVPPLDLSVSAAFRECTLDALASRELDDVEAPTFTVYEGATPDRDIDGMFSFVPCLPVGDGHPRFRRPALRIPGIINPRSWRGVSGAARELPNDTVRSIWGDVVGQVLAAGLDLGVELGTPPRRQGHLDDGQV